MGVPGAPWAGLKCNVQPVRVRNPKLLSNLCVKSKPGVSCKLIGACIAKRAQPVVTQLVIILRCRTATHMACCPPSWTVKIGDSTTTVLS